MSKKAWIIFASVCILFLAGLVFFSSKDKINVSSVNDTAIQTASTQSGNIADHVFGKAGSKVVLIEYGDFECPGCGAAHPIVKEISKDYKDQIAFVFRNFPLTSLHPNARAAAAAAEAAGLQGKYWQMHDKLYEAQNEWKSLAASERTDMFADYAKQLGLNVDTFKTDLGGANVSQKINFDRALGSKANVTATPTFFLNGEEMKEIRNEQGSLDATKLDKAIADALKKNDIPLPKE